MDKHLRGKRSRTVGYGLAALAGAWSLAFPSNTLADPLHYWAVVIWAAILLASAGVSCAASATQSFRIEYVSAVPVLGCIVAYDVGLWYWTFGASGDQPQPASGGAALIVLALAALIAGRVKDMHVTVTGRM